ncbi:HutD family protein, partial [Thioclava sp. BHET1]
AEDGAFSLLPGIDRVLTVISGPGFDLVGGPLPLRADPLCPVAFSGDVAIVAEGVAAPSQDFNLMLARGLAVPEVRLLAPGESLSAPVLALFLLAQAEIGLPSGSVTGGARDLLILEGGASLLSGGPVLAVPLPAGLI